jgi:TrmH family RNA methyltransferase
MPETITSTHNAFVKRARKLVRNRRYREGEERFLIEGIAHVRQAIDNVAPIEEIILAPDLLTSESARLVVEEQRAAGTDIVHLGREAFESIVEREHPSGLAAVVRMEERKLSDLVAGATTFFVGLHDVGNPGNLGSIIRTVDAVGGGGVVIVGESTDEYHPAAVKASMGTIFTVPIFRAATIDDLFAWALMEDVAIVTTSARTDLGLWEVDLPLPALYLFGSEATGLPVDILERGALKVRIPMEGAASSLNLAVSVAVLLYEAKRRIIR